MKALLTSLLAFALTVGLSRPAPAESPAPQAVADLKLQYQASVARTVHDLTDIYKNKLLEMKQKFATSGDNAGVIAITSELNRIGATSPVLAQAPGTTSVSDAKSPSTNAATSPDGLGDERFFAGKSWFSSPKSEFHFNRDGTGWRKDDVEIKLPFTWKKLNTGIIHATGILLQGGPPRDWYFMFNNRKTALYGTSPTSMPSPLRPD